METYNRKETGLITSSKIGSHGICQLLQTHDMEKKKEMFTKKYKAKDKSIAFHEILINERLNSLEKNSFITKFYDYQINNHGDVLVNFEYSDLGSLFDCIINQENGKQFLDIDFLKTFILRMINGLIAIHREGIIHNDLKLENILIFKSDESHPKLIPKIADFNNSLLYDAAKDEVMLFLHEPYNCFPVFWEKPSFQFDYWCLGVMIYQLLLHESPFTFNDDLSSFIYNVKSQSFKNTDKFKNITPFILQDLIEKLLVYDVNKRLCDDNILYHPFFKTSNRKNKLFFIQRKRQTKCKKW